MIGLKIDPCGPLDITNFSLTILINVQFINRHFYIINYDYGVLIKFVCPAKWLW